MDKKISKTAVVALGVGVISKGAEAISAGDPTRGLAMLVAGAILVYGYEVLQEKQIGELYEAIEGLGD